MTQVNPEHIYDGSADHIGKMIRRLVKTYRKCSDEAIGTFISDLREAADELEEELGRRQQEQAEK